MFSYEDLISGDSIYVDKVGHIRSPFLWELKPTKGIGYWRYNLYLNLIAWGKLDYIKYLRVTGAVGAKGASALENPKIGVFELMRLIRPAREALCEAMSFFMDEEVRWNKESSCFEVVRQEDGKVVGHIDHVNFDSVRAYMLQVNYIDAKETKAPKFKDEKAKALWEKVQAYQQKLGTPKRDKALELGNIISKLCVASNTYNLFNVYDLTVYQLYDQFFQCGYLRAMSISERAFSIHGGKKFKMETWLNPINKN